MKWYTMYTIVCVVFTCFYRRKIMANLLNIKRVVSTRAPRIPTIAPDAKTSDKLKNFGYYH